MRVTAIAVLLALGGVMASEPAEAHGRARVSIGLGFGYPYWGWGGPWWYYPPPYYYYPAPVVVRSEPVTYIEQSTSAPSATSGGNWWYYCDASRGYYPYVRECPSGWQRVPPAPAK